MVRQDPESGDGQLIQYSDEMVYLGMKIKDCLVEKALTLEFKARAIFNSLNNYFFS